MREGFCNGLSSSVRVLLFALFFLLSPAVGTFSNIHAQSRHEIKSQQLHNELHNGQRNTEEFGPAVRAYLEYLRAEQEVVDDRASRSEISAQYYRHNINRIRALRQLAIRIAEESGNDYIPDLTAVTVEEFKTLFEHSPRASELKVGELIGTSYRYIGKERYNETFYIFVRLDPYEQSELKGKSKPVDN
ncbi:MAG: hypothetical protein ACRD63_06405 [Pyrinomonadaceae bacterium]